MDLAKDENYKQSLISLKRRELVQCLNCQDYGHTRTYCSYTPRCIRYGKNHTSSFWDKPNDAPPTCALYQGNHPANYRGYQIHKKLQKHRNKSTSIPSPQNVNPIGTQVNSQTTLPSLPLTTTQPQLSYSKATFAAKHIPSSPNINLQTDTNSTLNNFMSEFKSIIIPFI